MRRSLRNYIFDFDLFGVPGWWPDKTPPAIPGLAKNPAGSGT